MASITPVELELLQRQLDDLRNLNLQAKRQLDEERARAEEQRARAEKAEEEMRFTTLDEYLDACHEQLFSKLAVETNPKRTTKGTMTSPSRKRVPARLLPWEDFLTEQRKASSHVHSNYPATSRAFLSRAGMQGVAQLVGMSPIGNEKQLERFQKDAVELPVMFIIKELRNNPGIREYFRLAEGGVEFKDYYNQFAEASEEPAEPVGIQQEWEPTDPTRDRQEPEMLEPADIEQDPEAIEKPGEPASVNEGPKTPDNPSQRSADVFCGRRLQQLRADQICVSQLDAEGNKTRTLFVVEYKPPHKLTLNHLRLGLHEMDILEEVVKRTPPPPSSDERFQFNAKLLVSAAVVQTFHYMIEAGLEYSYLTTGQAFVFLKVDWKDPTKLYYHLAEPAAEVKAHEGQSRYCTAVSQVLTFALTAASASFHSQNEITKAERLLKRWEVDFRDTVACLPVSDRDLTPPASSYIPRTYDAFDRSPYLLRVRPKKATCIPGVKSSGSDSKSDSDDDDHEDSPDNTPIRHRNVNRVIRPCPPKTNPSEKDSRGTRQYCTQRCLLGLIRGDPLDQACPNVSLHRRTAGQHHHAVDHETWLRLLHEQLRDDLDTDISPLGIQGARGAMFWITLTAYGYTVLAKGTVPGYIKDIQHEANVYRRLSHLQGSSVPVVLGVLQLANPYYYDLDVQLRHFLLLSWGGPALDEAAVTQADVTKRRVVAQEMVKSLRDCHLAGVLQRDVCARNALWSEELGKVLVIDFERARMVPKWSCGFFRERSAMGRQWNNNQNESAMVRKGMGMDKGRIGTGKRTVLSSIAAHGQNGNGQDVKNNVRTYLATIKREMDAELAAASRVVPLPA